MNFKVRGDVDDTIATSFDAKGTSIAEGAKVGIPTMCVNQAASRIQQESTILEPCGVEIARAGTRGC